MGRANWESKTGPGKVPTSRPVYAESPEQVKLRKMNREMHAYRVSNPLFHGKVVEGPKSGAEDVWRDNLVPVVVKSNRGTSKPAEVKMIHPSPVRQKLEAALRRGRMKGGDVEAQLKAEDALAEYNKNLVRQIKKQDAAAKKKLKTKGD